MSTSAATHQKQKCRPTLTEADEKDVFDRIDLSGLEAYSSDEIGRNHRVGVQDHILGSCAPPEYFYHKKTNLLLPRYIIEREHKAPDYKNIVGQRVTPTRINSLLTQNPSGGIRPSSQFYWKRQLDESYYTQATNKELASFLAETEPNYYIVEGNSKHRLKFKCPHLPKGFRVDRFAAVIDEEENVHDDPLLEDLSCTPLGPKEMDDLSIYIDPDNDRARWACPRCTEEASQKHMSMEECEILGHRHQTGSAVAIFHDIPRTLRIELASDRIIPGKEYKYADRLAEIPKLIRYIINNQGASLYEIDNALNWPNGTAERIINTKLKDRVELRKKRKGHKGCKVYIYH